MSVYHRAKSKLGAVIREWRTRGARASRADSGSREMRFQALLRSRKEWLLLHLPEASANYIYDLHGKDKQKLLANRLGLSTAEEYLTDATFADALSFIATSSHERFVLKPISGKSGSGVFCLSREAGGYRDLKSGKLRTPARLKELAAQSYGRLGRADSWLVEELLAEPGGSAQATDDFKFFCFGGRAELTLQKGFVGPKSRRRPAIRFYDRDGTPVNTGIRPYLISDQLELPPSIGALLAEAERASSLITTPFIRIDLYDTHRGVVLGELTPSPGGLNMLNPEWDARLAGRWHESAKALEQGLATGEIKPLMPTDDFSVEVLPAPAPAHQ